MLNNRSRDNRRRKKKIIIGIVAAIAVIGLFALGLQIIEKMGLQDVQFGDTGEWDDGGDIIELSLDDKIYVSTDNVDTYLIIGTDSGGEDQGEMFSGELADFITLLLVDNTTEKYGFLQIDRNSMVEMAVPDEEGNDSALEEMQICISHWYGKTQEERNEYTATAVTTLLGDLDVYNVYSLEMTDIGKVNHAIGGVEVDITSDMMTVDPAFVRGATVLLTDEQAEKFVRARMGVGEGTNAERMDRQNQYMQKVYNLVMSQIRENPDYINVLYDELKDVVYTEGSDDDFSRMANQLTKYKSKGIMRFNGKIKNHDTLGDGIEHEEFYVDETSIVQCLQKIMNLEEAEEGYDE